MAIVGGNLWEYNLARVRLIDVTDDYTLMQPPLPSEFYPVLAEVWIPRYNLQERLSQTILIDGYLYDWHESPAEDGGTWYVGVVQDRCATSPPVGEVIFDR